MSNNRLLLLQPSTGLHSSQPQVPDRLRRDPETQRPTIRSQSLLGALRKQMRNDLYAEFAQSENWKQAAAEHPDMVALFGSPEEPGALNSSDVQLLFLPVRSLQGVFSWVTSPAVLTSLVLNLATLDLTLLPEVPNLKGFELLCHPDHRCLLEQHMLLEEISLNRKGDATAIFEWLSQKGLLADHPMLEQLNPALAIISDTAFEHFSRYAMQTMVRSQASFKHQKNVQHIEFIPTESLLYSVLSLDEPQEWEQHQQRMPAYLSIGSHLSTGYGLCRSNLVAPKEPAHV